ncbi:metal-dependent hydrolase [Desulfovirgula thermocuniculi]|uniref:metal-dependent hydrolase n=1 Tax=Desulfovirgula thermocuniculi TaxID=348842 RepID=UPI0004263025|nr:metal-dependent hydrolase [Desulfovirgula thermocuniculi]
MTGKTHAAAGAFVGAALGHLAGEPYLGMALGALGGLLPDVDHPGSWAGRRLRPVAVLLENLAGHRTVTHTLWFALFLGGLGALLAACLRGLAALSVWFAALALFVGALSHLALDALTRSGIEPLAPVKSWHVRGPLVTGDPFVEWPAAALFALGALRLAGLI